MKIPLTLFSFRSFLLMAAEGPETAALLQDPRNPRARRPRPQHLIETLLHVLKGKLPHLLQRILEDVLQSFN
jgi:hypothetical protein